MSEERIFNDKRFSGSTIKIIAIISMVIDHTGSVFVNDKLYPELYQVMRGIGRIAFPIFCFLLVQGFIHTSNVKKYILRLAVLALISEIPFDLAFFNQIYYWKHQNVFFTLLIGLFVLVGMKFYEKKTAGQIFVFLLGAIVAISLQTDYSIGGILLMALLYRFRSLQIERISTVIIFNILMGQLWGICSIPFIELYNGKRGMRVKYLFYGFYPFHLMMIYVISKYLC